MFVQTENNYLQDDHIPPVDIAQDLTPNQMRERDAAYATLKAISDHTGKPIAAVIAELRKLMLRDA